MSRTPEGKVKDKVTELLRSINAYYFFPPANGYGRHGIPDIVGCVNGRFFGIECKAGYNKPTTLQEKEMAAINSAGGFTFVAREDTLDLLRDSILAFTSAPVS